jgi:hypothetical protein
LLIPARRRGADPNGPRLDPIFAKPAGKPPAVQRLAFQVAPGRFLKSPQLPQQSFGCQLIRVTEYGPYVSQEEYA